MGIPDCGVKYCKTVVQLRSLRARGKVGRIGGKGGGGDHKAKILENLVRSGYKIRHGMGFMRFILVIFFSRHTFLTIIILDEKDWGR